MAVKAKATTMRMSPRKVGEVVSLIRGRSVADALVILEHTPRAAAKPVAKLLNSAVANAENNHGYDVETLEISHISVGPGLRMKRYRPAAHGRALPYRKHSSVVTVEVDGKKKAPKQKAARKKTGSGRKTKETGNDNKAAAKEDK